MNRNLIISPVGDHSVHHTWINGPDTPNFDLFLIYYGDGPDAYAPQAQYYERRKGFKWEHIHFVSRQYSELLQKYDHIWCPDDDVACDTASVNLLFEVFGQYQLQLAQPAIAEGDLSFKGFAQRRGNVLRYTPYVEIMCPLFTRQAFCKVQGTFLETRSGWGLDWLWPRHFAKGEMAIIDKVGVHHTGRIGKGENYSFLAKLGIDPYREFEDALARHGGFDRGLHHRMLRGRVRMPYVRDPEDRRSLSQRIFDYVRWLRLKRSSA